MEYCLGLRCVHQSFDKGVPVANLFCFIPYLPGVPVEYLVMNVALSPRWVKRGLTVFCFYVVHRKSTLLSDERRNEFHSRSWSWAQDLSAFEF